MGDLIAIDGEVTSLADKLRSDQERFGNVQALGKIIYLADLSEYITKERAFQDEPEDDAKLIVWAKFRALSDELGRALGGQEEEASWWPTIHAAPRAALAVTNDGAPIDDIDVAGAVVRGAMSHVLDEIHGSRSSTFEVVRGGR
jgi:hypothetical protein